jgi:hypothetical protein
VTTSYKYRRSEIWKNAEKNWPRMAAQDFFVNWDQPKLMPDIGVEDRSLVPGLECLYANDRADAVLFLQRAIAVADRVLADNKFRASTICEAGYPHNLGVVLRGRAYARWLLGEPLDRKAMRRVAECMTEWCLTKATDCKQFHRSMTMSCYLEGVRAAMIASDLDYASDLLKTKYKFRWHHAVELDLWTRLIAAYPDVSADLRQEAEVFFDRVRDPDFEEKPDGKVPTFINRDILALETGIIRQIYLVDASPHDPVDPQAVIDAVGY